MTMDKSVTLFGLLRMYENMLKANDSCQLGTSLLSGRGGVVVHTPSMEDIKMMPYILWHYGLGGRTLVLQINIIDNC